MNFFLGSSLKNPLLDYSQKTKNIITVECLARKLLSPVLLHPLFFLCVSNSKKGFFFSTLKFYETESACLRMTSCLQSIHPYNMFGPKRKKNLVTFFRCTL